MRASLGQNFLTNKHIAEKIVESANLSSSDNVLEIGPGKGILTELLAQKAGRVLAVEIDSELIKTLKKKFKERDLHVCHPRGNGDPEKSLDSRLRGNDKKRITIINADILKTNLPKLLKENNFKNYKIVANLPYYITSKIIRLLLETRYPPAEMVLMVQKEVGERICAPSGKESILSISVKLYAEPEIIFFVPRENFDPIPEVDSAVIRIKRKENIPDMDTKKLFSLVKAGFSSKRKMITNNLSTSFNIPKNELAEILKKAGIKPTQRAQELSVDDWLRLCDVLAKLKTQSAKRKTKT
ncbi:MAG: rRNA adenine dimethyltransferase family protein [Candidatus Moranbacteria bacterium]|nr:rRNA adenine dimethyltransferase family protein [Candidatus Moranbacteria bacterium]